MTINRMLPYVSGFSNELEKIAESEKDAGAFKKLMGGLALTGALAVGVKTMNTAPAAGSAANAMTQTLRGTMGGAGSNARTLAQYGIRG